MTETIDLDQLELDSTIGFAGKIITILILVISIKIVPFLFIFKS